MDMGYDYNIAVLTRPEGYRKEPADKKMISMLRLVYGHRYPKLVEDMENRHIVYNQELELAEKLEKEGKAFILRPSVDMHISRLEKDQDKLRAIYDLGYEDAREHFDEIAAFAEKAKRA